MAAGPGRRGMGGRRLIEICAHARITEASERRKATPATDKPVTTYIVSVYEKPHWRTVLTTKDRAKAEAMAKEIGEKVRVEEITPRPKRR